MKLNKPLNRTPIINPDAFVLTNANVISSVSNENKKDLIINLVCKIYERERSEVFSKTRKRVLLEPRQLIQFLLKQYTDYSNAEIGFFTGGLDHATVINARKVWRDLLEVSAIHRERVQIFSVKYHEKIEEMKSELYISRTNACATPNDRIIRNWKHFKHEFE